jgi:glycosyltransferase involved in cell wall biosynthesis
MATYNGGKYVEEQVNSILPQLGASDELVVSDDGSTDDTIQRLQRFSDERIRLLLWDGVHRGYSRNFERALKAARGDLLFLADQDDVWLPERVEKCLVGLEGADMVVMDAVVVDKNLETINPSHFSQTNARQGFWANFLMTRYIGACMAFRRCVFERALPFPKNDRFCPHDYWIACVAEAFFTTALLRSPGMLYRRHLGTATSLIRESSVARELGRVIKRIYTAMQLSIVWICKSNRSGLSLDGERC